MKTAIVALALAAATAAVAGDLTEIDGMSIPDLKSVYLGCEARAQGNQISTDEIRLCTVVYETLKDKAFDGSFQLLNDWYQTQTVAPARPGAGSSELALSMSWMS